MDQLIQSMVQETFALTEQQENGFSYTLEKNTNGVSLILYAKAANTQAGEHFFPLPYHGPFSVIFEQFHQQIFYDLSTRNLKNNTLHWWSARKIHNQFILENNPKGDFLLGPLGDFLVACHFFSKIPGVQIENQEGKICIPETLQDYTRIIKALVQGELPKLPNLDKSTQVYLSERALMRLFWLEIQSKISSIMH